MDEETRPAVQLGLDVDVPVAIRLPRGLGTASQLVLVPEQDQGDQDGPSWR